LCGREKGGLSSLSLFTDRMPRKVRLVVDVLVILLSILFAGIMLWFGIQRCLTQIRSNRTTSILQLPEWYYSSFVPIGGALLILHFIEKMVDDIQECISCTDGGEGPAR
ncbi:MAG: TRAP transporter small permease, partial [Lachnospiraceae bacterium]|nr:TRAP transporter small permease [Lachnospiraceae bacterium]